MAQQTKCASLKMGKRGAGAGCHTWEGHDVDYKGTPGLGQSCAGLQQSLDLATSGGRVTNS